jgi:hypothetical protein
MTYKEIQDVYRKRNNKGISTCAIADAKRKLGFPVKVSKRRIDINKIKKSASNHEIEEVGKILKKK